MWKRLNEVWGTWLDMEDNILETTGVFSYMATALPVLFENIFNDLQITYADLDLEYHGMFSGKKLISDLPKHMLDENEKLTPARKRMLSEMIIRSNYDRWKKIADTYQLEYNPISNYDMEEEEHGGTKTQYGKTDTRTDNLLRREDTSDALHHGESITQSGDRSQTLSFTNRHDVETKTVAGWNSTDFSNADKNDTSHVGTEKTQNGGSDTEAHTGTDTRTVGSSVTDTGTQTVAQSGMDTETTNRTLKRSGNIGVTTSQQMLQSERDLWVWDFVREVVFKDVDKVLTLMVY